MSRVVIKIEGGIHQIAFALLSSPTYCVDLELFGIFFKIFFPNTPNQKLATSSKYNINLKMCGISNLKKKYLILEPIHYQITKL